MGFEIPMHALDVYSQTGHAPDTPRWNMLEARMERNPGRFEFYHPTLAPLLTDAKSIGMLPGGKFYDGLRGRYEQNPGRFTHNHPLLGELLDRDANAREHFLTADPIRPPSGTVGLSPEGLGPPKDSLPTFPQTVSPTDSTPSVVAVPEPATYIQLGIGLIFIGIVSAFKRKKATNLHASFS